MRDPLIILVINLGLGLLPWGWGSSRAHGNEDTSRVSQIGQGSVEESWLAPVEIFGSDQSTLSTPMASQKITRQKLEALQTNDLARALKQVSGAYVREEDGQGLRPNIGLRGTNPDRSKKVSLYRDGVLIGPAPYSAPAAYYTPSLLMMDSLEVFKGFAALPYGPNSIGGAINFKTTPWKEFNHLDVYSQVGSFNYQVYRLKAERAFDGGSVLFDGARLSSDGFKILDLGGNTGFIQNHGLIKLKKSLAHPTGLAHELQLSTSYGDELSNETYLGLTEQDFYSQFRRRYSSSALDKMNWEHKSIELRHLYQPSARSMLQTTVYNHTFDRTWFRADRFQDSSVSLRQILLNSTNFSNYYNILTGDQDSSSLGANGDLILVSNHRIYFSRGVQLEWNRFPEAANQGHEISTYLRWHQDQIDRDHKSQRYEMTSRRLIRSAALADQDTLNVESAQAWTAGAQDHIHLDRYTVTPAVRVEMVDFSYENRLNSQKTQRSDFVALPGLSILRRFGSEVSLRASVNRAATIAGLSPTGEEVREEATLFELELNYLGESVRREGQFTFFLNNYDNLIGTCTVSTGCANSQIDAQFNGGRARVFGVEAKLGQVFNAFGWQFPVTWNATLLSARFLTNFQSTSPEWGIGMVREGDHLPYVPRAISTLSLGARRGRLSQEISLAYQSEILDQSVQETRFIIPAYGVVDWSIGYAYSRRGKINFKADNVLGREYAVAARPFGLRPGKPQAFQIGIQHTF